MHFRVWYGTITLSGTVANTGANTGVEGESTRFYQIHTTWRHILGGGLKIEVYRDSPYPIHFELWGSEVQLLVTVPLK